MKPLVCTPCVVVFPINSIRFLSFLKEFLLKFTRKDMRATAILQLFCFCFSSKCPHLVENMFLLFNKDKYWSTDTNTLYILGWNFEGFIFLRHLLYFCIWFALTVDLRLLNIGYKHYLPAKYIEISRLFLLIKSHKQTNNLAKLQFYPIFTQKIRKTACNKEQNGLFLGSVWRVGGEERRDKFPEAASTNGQK